MAELIEAHEPPERAAALRAFAAAYLHRIPLEEGVEAEALRHELTGAFDLVAGRNGAASAVRAFTPSVETHGYDAGGSVVETNTDDLSYLVDSLTAALRARGLTARRVLHPIIGTERDHEGRLLRVLGPREAPRRESVMHIELDRTLDQPALEELEQAVTDVLGNVRRVVADFPAMTQRIGAMIEYARSGAGRYSFEEVNEATQFLRWLLDGNFTFLGYREYEAADGMLRVLPGSGLGLLSDETSSDVAQPRPIETLRPEVQERIHHGELLLVTKTNRRSPVRANVRMDYIGVRHVSPDGSRVGEARLLGLFTRKAYSSPASETPLLNHKLRRILEAEDLIDGSHDHRAAVAIFGSFPKDELFASPTEALRRAIVELLGLQADQVRLLGRRYPDGRTAALIAALPRARYDPRVLARLQEVLGQRYGPGATVESHVVLTEDSHMRVHFAVHDPEGLPDVDPRELEAELVRIARTWDEQVERALRARHGRARARALVEQWAPRFPEFYKVATLPELAASDIEHLEELEASDEGFVVGLQNAWGRSGPRTRLALYKRGGKVPLSEFLPTLEALGLRVYDERPTRLDHGDGDTFIQNFGVLGPDSQPLDLADAGARVAEVIAAVRRGEAESGTLNRLVVTAGLTWRQVGVLRAYRSYRQRVGSRFSARYEADAFARHPITTRKLVEYFERRFDPARERDEAAEQAIKEDLLAEFDLIESLDEDRIMRDHLALIDATLRTNAFKPGREVLALKIRSGDVRGMPQPAPYVEIYVHGTEVEGVHLRGGAVARGGLRWSDRMDFRTEVFGLMRAQMTKNAVIVPTGAKGGFLLKRRPSEPAALKADVERQYRRFIRGLLDVTDNLRDGKVVHPEHVRVLDGDDPYLVVAADKGTATFSDTANAISAEYGFWLGDAFASGGSVGYDHKALGITARGAWESVKRHFRELGVDPQREEITVVGIGDMSGDVFGNGMLLSDRLRLIAAYDHRHVFLDPSPDAATSHAERRRLFELPASSWADYDADLISAGGGVFPRTAKSIALSPEIRAALGVEDAVLTPDEVIRAILRAPVDLLFNGGIGTVVKASSETDAAARDRASDAIRVDARDLRCRVAGEGGNLGFTQRARIEFAEAGGRINADFIDNSAGVDCSDHEVNLKILLDRAVANGEIDYEGRNALLKAVTEDVTAHVLHDSYRQARILSREVGTAAARLYAYEDLMTALEEEGILDRDVDALPTAADLAQRRRSGQGLQRPELAVLLAHAKRSLTEALLESDLVDDPWFERDLRGYFPPAVLERFGHRLGEHRLRRDLVATLVANEVVDALGPSFVSRLATELGATQADVVRAYRIARDVTGAVGRWAAIDGLGTGIDRAAEVELAEGVEGLVESTVRWYLSHPPEGDLGEAIAVAHEGFERLEAALEEEPPDEAAEVVEHLELHGVPPSVALGHALAGDLANAPDVIAVAGTTGREVEEVGRAFTAIREQLRLGWLAGELESLPASTRVQRWAVQALRDDARRARREIVSRLLAQAPGAAPEEAVSAFLEANRDRCRHLSSVVESLSVDGSDLAGLMVAVRELRAMAD